MNELELIASLRDEVPLTTSSRFEEAVLAEIASAHKHAPDGGRRHRTPRLGRGPVPRKTRRAVLRPVVAGALAVAVGAGVYAGVNLSSSGSSAPTTVAWSGRPTAPWPTTSHPSYGRATSEAQLIAYITRAAAAMPGRAPKPSEWVAVKVEHAGSSGGEGGYLFGPPNLRDIELAWYRGDGCGAASIPAIPVGTLVGNATIRARLTISTGPYYYGVNCHGSTLAGWTSLTYSYLNSLPTDPIALEDVLARTDGSVFAGSREQVIFQAIDALLDAGEMQGVVVPPKLSATMYRVLQHLDGVTFERTTDLADRHGMGFYMVLEGYYKMELVINPDNYTYMGFKDVAIRDHAMTGTDGTQYVKAGHVMGWVALLGQAIVDKPGQLPG